MRRKREELEYQKTKGILIITILLLNGIHKKNSPEATLINEETTTRI